MKTSKIWVYSLASSFCAFAVLTEANRDVQSSFLTAFVILVAMALGEALALKDGG